MNIFLCVLNFWKSFFFFLPHGVQLVLKAKDFYCKGLQNDKTKQLKIQTHQLVDKTGCVKRSCVIQIHARGKLYPANISHPTAVVIIMRYIAVIGRPWLFVAGDSNGKRDPTDCVYRLFAFSFLGNLLLLLLFIHATPRFPCRCPLLPHFWLLPLEPYRCRANHLQFKL